LLDGAVCIHVISFDLMMSFPLVQAARFELYHLVRLPARANHVWLVSKHSLKKYGTQAAKANLTLNCRR